jgi:hypothetical protein
LGPRHRARNPVFPHVAARHVGGEILVGRPLLMGLQWACSHPYEAYCRTPLRLAWPHRIPRRPGTTFSP